MKRKIHILIFASMLILACLFLSSCGVSSPPSEKSISADLADSITGQYIDNEPQTLAIKKVTIDKRQTNKKEKTDFVYCTIEMENDSFSFTGHYYCEYVYYDKGGWILESFNEDEPSEIRAVSGVSSVITDMMKDRFSDEYESVELGSQKFYDDKQSDYLVYKVYNKDEYSEVTGNIECEFHFNGYEWSIAETEPKTTRILLGGLTADDVSKLEQNLKQQYGIVTQYSRETDLQKGMDYFVYNCVNEYPYLTESTPVTVVYYFYPENKWTFDTLEKGKKTEDWNITGTWDMSGRVFSLMNPDTQKRITAKIIITQCSEVGCSGTYEYAYPSDTPSTGSFNIAFESNADNFRYETKSFSLGQSPFIEISRKEGVRFWTVDRGYLESVTFTSIDGSVASSGNTSGGQSYDLTEEYNPSKQENVSVSQLIPVSFGEKYTGQLSSMSDAISYYIELDADATVLMTFTHAVNNDVDGIGWCITSGGSSRVSWLKNEDVTHEFELKKGPNYIYVHNDRPVNEQEKVAGVVTNTQYTISFTIK